MAYNIEDEEVAKLAACPRCGAKKGKPCVGMSGRTEGKPCKPHPPRVQEAKREEYVRSPYPEKQQVADNAYLLEVVEEVPPSRFLHPREMAEYARSCKTNVRHTSVKVPKRQLQAMVAEILALRLKTKKKKKK